MKKHILFSLLLVASLSLAACTKAKKEEAVEEEATEESAMEESAAPASGEEISMLEHLKAVNTKMCETLVKQQPGKTVEECTAELNKLSELNPQNATTMVSKPASQKCLDYLGTASETDIMLQSAQGDCALSSLQGE